MLRIEKNKKWYGSPLLDIMFVGMSLLIFSAILVFAGISYPELILTIVFVIWFFLPAGLANMTPIFAARLPYIKRLSFPLDGYITFRGKRLLGDHKTVRGLLSGILVAIGTVYLQQYAFEHVPLVRIFVPLNYVAINPLLFGLLSALGALGGDTVKSFFKRQLAIAPGKSWFPFDQMDYIVGGIALTAFYTQLTLVQYMLLFLIWFLLHPLATIIGYFLKLKDSLI